VNDPTFFCYYAALGDQKKLDVQAILFYNRDNHFIYDQLKNLLTSLNILDREKTDTEGKTWLTLYADDITKAYTHFASEPAYAEDKEWKELTYQLKLSLYTRFPELVRKLKPTTEN